MGQKPVDLCAVLACSACHDVMDGRSTNKSFVRNSSLDEYILDALCRTLDLWTKEGFVK
jgi:hypothetical protein